MRLLNGILLLALCVVPCMAAEKNDSSVFDKPVNEQQIPLPPDPANPQTKPMLSCFYYPHYLVKQIDLGEEGADQFSIINLRNGQNKPACTRENVKDEMLFGAQWCGYFEGVKGDFVFLAACDGSNDGTGFAVFSRSDGTQIFQDNEAKIQSIGWIEHGSPATQKITEQTTIELRYQRVYLASCSLRQDEKSCWKNIQRSTGLTDPEPPICTGYKDQTDNDDPSVLTYEVEVVLDMSSTVLRVAPISKATKCYAAE